MLRIMIIIAGILLLSISAFATDTPVSSGPVFSGGLEMGYYGGAGFQAYGMVSNLAQNFPLNLRLAIGRASIEPGLSDVARQVFINDATNGIPAEKGRQFDYRFDMLYPVQFFKLPKSYLYGGLRHARFLANFKYIGGNEDFDVKSNQWGLGGGVESFFAISARMDLVLHMGVDYFFKSRLIGHDTEYAPDGDDVNARDGYTYENADAAINQPKFEPQLMLGVAYNF